MQFTLSSCNYRVFEEHPADSVSCNTEKDKQSRLHYRTAGNLLNEYIML